MPVIAMNQEMASLGKDVAEALAQELKLSLVKNEVVDHVAQNMSSSTSLIRRVVEGKAGLITRMTTDNQSLSNFVAEAVFEQAAQGNVIIRGWGATFLLREIPHIPCIRVCAPMENRVAWLKAKLGTDDEELVREELLRSDAAHTRNMEVRFGAVWGDPLLYDLVLNTNRLSVDACVGQVKALLAQPAFRETPESQQKLRDAELAAHVRAALRRSEEASDVHIVIEARQGRVRLAGIVADEFEAKAAQKVAAAVKGVSSVEADLKLFSRQR